MGKLLHPYTHYNSQNEQQIRRNQAAVRSLSFPSAKRIKILLHVIPLLPRQSLPGQRIGRVVLRRLNLVLDLFANLPLRIRTRHQVP